MFQRILIPLDGSPRAELILSQVDRLWRREASELILVHCHSVYSPVDGAYDTIPSLGAPPGRCPHLSSWSRPSIQGHGGEGPYPGARRVSRRRDHGRGEAGDGDHDRDDHAWPDRILEWLIGSIADKVLRRSCRIFSSTPFIPRTRRRWRRTSGALASADPGRHGRQRDLDGHSVRRCSLREVRFEDRRPARLGLLCPGRRPLLWIRPHDPSPKLRSSEDEVTARWPGDSRPPASRSPGRQGTGNGRGILDHSFKQKVDLIALGP